MLVLAKAPVPGQVKTRLADRVGAQAAAEVAAAALLDTLDSCEEAVGAEACHLALAGDLGEAVQGAEIAARLRSWTVFAQRGGHFGARIAHAHRDSAVRRPGPLMQIGMDTPQLRAGQLHEVAGTLADHDAVLGSASDGGWWVLALHDAAYASALVDVPMSTDRTGAETRAALERSGLRVGEATELRDVDAYEDADHALVEAPFGRFAGAWLRARDGGPA